MTDELDAALDAAKNTEEYKQAWAMLSDRQRRLDQIYWIKDETGTKTRFVRNEAQRRFSVVEHSRNLIVKARQMGFSTLIDIEMLDRCMFRKDTAGGIVDENLKKAREKLAKIRYAYEFMPKKLKDAVPLTRDAAEELAWANGSNITVGTSHRGGTLQLLHVSEYGKISVNKPDVAREIKTGALPAVHIRGQIWVESTAHGINGEFYQMVQDAQRLEKQGSPLSALDFKLQFFPWWLDEKYRLPANVRVIPQEMVEYFKKLKAENGINIDGQQAAWYCVTSERLGPDDMKSEFPSTIEEAFFNSLEGAYFKEQMTRARTQGRVGGLIPHDPTYRVNTTWDIGEDTTAIWFHQTDGLRHRWIDYWEGEGESLQAGARVVDEKRKERGFIYETHFGPHDLENRDWGDNSRSRKQQAKELGINFTVVERTSHKADSIEAARRIINMSWFDQEHCKRGVDCLDNYSKQWNDTLGQWKSEPLHNWASHGADAIQQLAMKIEDKRPSEGRPFKPAKKSGASSWSA